MLESGSRYNEETKIDFSEDRNFDEYHFCGKDLCMIGVPSFDNGSGKMYFLYAMRGNY